jgi:DNA-binding transcriptional LysR family regulator
MNERQLLAFKYVLEYGTVTKAADLLNVTQSAVSQMITNLEDDLGFQVFERRQGKVASSTPQGRRFIAEAESVLGSIDKARRAADELRNMSVGNFRIASTSGFAMSLVPNALARFNKKHPDVTTSLQTHHSREVRELVASRIFDVGVCEHYEFELVQSPEIEYFSVPCALVCHRNDPLAELSLITPKDLERHVIISPYDQHPTTIALRQAFHDEGMDWRPQVASNLYGAACRMVLYGGAVTWADPFTLAMLSNPILCARPFKPEVFLRFAIVKAPQEQELSHVTEMISLIREEIETISH